MNMVIRSRVQTYLLKGKKNRNYNRYGCNFSMKSLAPKTTLIVSFMGYKSKEIVVAQTDKKMRISLSPTQNHWTK